VYETDPQAGPPANRPSFAERVARRTFRSLFHRDYRYYFFGQLVSFTGSWMQSAALMWLSYDHTGQAMWPSIMLVAQVGPTLLLGPFGGALADRLNRKRFVFLTQCGFLFNALVLTTVVAWDTPSITLLLAVQILNGCVQGLDLPARLAFVPELVPRADLFNAVALNSTLFNAARLIGPALAAAVFWVMGDAPHAARHGAVVCFTLNALSYAAVLFSIWQIRAGNAPAKPKADGKPGNFWDGIRYLQTHPNLGGLVVLTGILASFAWPVLTLLPAFTRTVLNQQQTTYSMLVGCVGAGALCGALTTATFGNVKRRGRFLVLGCAMGTLGLFLLSVSSVPALAVVACAATGAGLILYLSTGQSTMQLSVPEDIRGRVMALWAMTLSASAPLGHLLSGYAAQTVPVPVVLRVLAAGAALATVGVVVVGVKNETVDRKP
jgi:MFS family permease